MDRSDVTLERMRTFVRVAERGSLSAVARELGVGQSTVTRHLGELEAALGVPLLSRTTRRVTLTDEGSRYYGECLTILRLVEQAGDAVRDRQRAAAGTIRLSCTASFGVLHVGRLLFAFQDRYPDITIDLSLSDAQVDLVREGVDMAIRLAPLTDSTLRLRALGQSRRVLVAAPRYLQAHGRPQQPRDLAALEGIRMTNVAGSDLLALQGPDGAVHRVPFAGRYRVDHGLAVREAVLAGRGIAHSHVWLVADLVAAGRLEVILADYLLPSVPMSLLIVPERAGISRIRLLAEYLVKAIATVPGLARPPAAGA